MLLYRQTVEDFGLFAGRELEPAEMENLRTANGEMSAKMRAVRIVSACNVSKRDLQQRLIQKGENPEDAENAVSWLEDLHLIDDRCTAQHIVERCISKGYGIARAKQALYEKRVPKELWEDVLSDYPDQSEKITAFLQSRLPKNSGYKDIRKVTDALLRQGHSYDQIRRCLNWLALNTDEFPEE